MKKAICLALLDDDLTWEGELHDCKADTFECGIAAHRQVVLDTLYNEVKGTLSVQKGRKRLVEAGITHVTDPSDKRFELVTIFLTDAKNKRDGT